MMICSGDLTRVGSGGDLMICSLISGAGSGLALDTEMQLSFSASSSVGLGRRSGWEDGVVAVVVGVFLLCALAADEAVEAVAVLPERI